MCTRVVQVDRRICSRLVSRARYPKVLAGSRESSARKSVYEEVHDGVRHELLEVGRELELTL